MWFSEIFQSRKKRQLEKQARLIYDNAFQFIGLCLPDGTLIDANKAALDVYGLSLDDVIGKLFWDAPWWEDETTKDQLKRAFATVAETKQMYRMETTHPDPSGSTIYVDFSLTPILDDSGEIEYVIPEGRDETNYHSLLDGFKAMHLHAPAGFAINDLETGQFIQTNNTFCDIVGYTENELLSMTYWDLTPEEFNQTEQDQLESMAQSGGYGPYEKEYIHKNGHRVPVMLSGVVYIPPKEERKTIWSIVQDMTKQKEHERTIYDLAFYDHLTGLPNRVQFIEYLTKRIKRTHNSVTLYLIDVDNFKKINDTLGYAKGDDVLCEISNKLLTCVRQHCVEDSGCMGFCARLGGDEFIIAVETSDPQEKDDITITADQILRSFDDPIAIGKASINVDVSLGISRFPADGTDVASLMRAADLALHVAKERGKNQHHFHSTSIKTKFDTLIEYEEIIRYFIETGNFNLHFQPIFDTKLRLPVGSEALFRGNEEKFGKLNIETLFDVAERTGLMVPLGTAIFKKACSECSKCTLLGTDRYVSVNVSPRQLEHADFIDMCLSTLEESNIRPQNVAIELTEHVILKNTSVVIEKLRFLQERGMQVFIDDFGKGYSTMSYLRLLPINKVKIDMMFVEGVGEDLAATEMVTAINNIAHSSERQTCAEGVETKKQLIALTELGIDQVQGYYIAKPMSFDDLKEWVKHQPWINFYD